MAYELQSLSRALDLLGCLEKRGPMSLTRLSEALHASPATCLRALRVLEQHGLVRRQIDSKDYALGVRLMELGERANMSIDLVRELRHEIQALSDEFNATAHVGVLRDGLVTVISKAMPPDGAVMYSQIGTRMPLHCTAMGKAILAAFGQNRMSEAGVKAPLAAYTRASITGLGDLIADIHRTQERGFSIDNEEYMPGYSCVGMALHSGADLYAFSLSAATRSNEHLLSRGRGLLRFAGMLGAELQPAVRLPTYVSRQIASEPTRATSEPEDTVRAVG